MNKLPGALAGLWSLLSLAAAQPASTNAGIASEMANQVNQLLSQASELSAEGDFEGAAREASTAIQLDPKNAPAYEVRGSIYIQEKLWDRADRDYTTADHLAPDSAYKFKLGEIKFLQKSYEDARPRFARLQNDPRLGDLATFKVFLCDLLGSHQAAALADLALLDQAPKSLPYYYCHATWDLFHNQRAEANSLLDAAQQNFDDTTNQLYIGILIATRDFHPDVASFIAKDGTKYIQSRVCLEADGLRASTPQGWVTLPLNQLPDDLSGFPQDLQESIGKLRESTIDAKTAATPNEDRISFVTKSGTTYHEVRWSADDNGLAILDANGWTTIPYRDLPDDLSDFPPNLRNTLLERRAAVPSAASATERVTFTTADGTHYDQVRASLAENGVHVLGASGWVTLSASQLPADLTVFPAEWQPQLRLARDHPDDDETNPLHVVSFTTRKGRQYTDVRASIEPKGLHLLTWQGWIAVPFDQLPADLTPFPESWRKLIAEGQAHVHSISTTR